MEKIKWSQILGHQLQSWADQGVPAKKTDISQSLIGQPMSSDGWKDYQYLDSDQKISQALQELDGCEILGLDVETSGLDFFQDKIRLLQLASPAAVKIIDLKSVQPKTLDLLSGFFGRQRTLICHNGKFDLAMLHRLGLRIDSRMTKVFCTMIASRLLDAGRQFRLLFQLERKHKKVLDENRLCPEIQSYFEVHRINLSESVKINIRNKPIPGTKNSYIRQWYVSDEVLDRQFQIVSERGEVNVFEKIRHRLQDVVWRYLDGTTIGKEEQTSDWTVEKLTESQLGYAGRDVHILLDLQEVLSRKLQQQNLTRVAEIEFNCLPATMMMELAGMKVDLQKLETTRRFMERMCEEASSAFSAVFGQVNLNSPLQVKQALQAKGVKCDSTGQEVLKPLAGKYPQIASLLSYRKYAAMLKKLDKLKNVHPVTGRIHPQFDPLNAYTGRFSCSKPNLQNIPRDENVGVDESIRACFVPQEGFQFVLADYSQAELRIAAEISQDRLMIEVFKSGQDLHQLTASRVLEKPVDQITSSERQCAKALNFGLIYGMGSSGLAAYASSQFGVPMTETEADRYREKFFDTYRGIRAWHDKEKLNPHREELRTRSGRLIHFAGKGFTQRLNTPIQSLAADLIKVALAILVRKLEQREARIICMVHDEIIVESEKSITGEIEAIVKAAMLQAGEELLTHVPLEVDISVADSWAGK